MGELVKREPKMPHAEPVLTDSGTLRELEKGAGASGNREPKKPYAVPRLTVYGTIVELTKRVGAHGTSDRGTFPHNRTAF